MDIHNTEQKLKALWKRIENEYTEKNQKIMREFQNEMYAHGLSPIRVLFYLSSVYVILRNSKKNAHELDMDDVKAIVAGIEKKRYAEWTKAKYKLSIKKFFQFLAGFEWNSQKYPESVSWINSNPKHSKLPRPIILTQEEVLKLFKACKGSREKAMCSFMYESGCRCPDELFHMKVGDVEFDEYGAKVKLTSGKVGTRVIRVVSCVPYLKTWINEEHPDADYGNWLWVNKGTRNHGRLMSYSSLKQLVRQWRKRAGIDKKITPYTFRRTRYTHLSTKWPTPVLYKYMGQVQGSKVIDRYVELNEESIDNTVLNFYGIKAQNNGDIKPLFCSRCNRQNPPDLEYCKICHAALTEKALSEVDTKKRTEMEDIFREMVRKFKVEMRSIS